jgi:hypothetical protein
VPAIAGSGTAIGSGNWVFGFYSLTNNSRVIQVEKLFLQDTKFIKSFLHHLMQIQKSLLAIITHKLGTSPSNHWFIIKTKEGHKCLLLDCINCWKTSCFLTINLILPYLTKSILPLEYSLYWCHLVFDAVFELF